MVGATVIAAAVVVIIVEVFISLQFNMGGKHFCIHTNIYILALTEKWL